MTHYICKGGCEGISDKPGACGAETCASHGKPLEPCTCEDDRHDGAFEDGAMSGGRKNQKEEEHQGKNGEKNNQP